MTSSKERILLAFAIMAPLMLIAYFLFKPYFTTRVVEGPQYDLLLSARTFGEPGPDQIIGYTYEVKDQKIRLVVRKAKPEERDDAVSDMYLFRFNAKEQTLERISFDATVVKNKLDEHHWVVDIPDIEKLRITLKKIAPDGYEYARKMMHRIAIFDIFDSRTPIHVVRKRSRNIVIPINYSRYGDIRFHGWILSEDK